LVTLFVQAEAHGLVPLVYAHLQAAGVVIPPAIKAHLLGYSMQHSYATRVIRVPHPLPRRMSILEAACPFWARSNDYLVHTAVSPRFKEEP
jgi:hypothetical protein